MSPSAAIDAPAPAQATQIGGLANVPAWRSAGDAIRLEPTPEELEALLAANLQEHCEIGMGGEL